MVTSVDRHSRFLAQLVSFQVFIIVHSFLSGGRWLDVAAFLVVFGMLPDGLLSQTVGTHIEWKWGIGYPSRRHVRTFHDPVILCTVSTVKGDP